MTARRPHPTLRATVAAAALAVVLTAACAQVEPPRGGPEDKTPPAVVAVSPDSGAVGLRGVDRIEIDFSEKIDPEPAGRWLRLYPPLDVRNTKWHGRRRAVVELRDTLPADTVIVVEVPRGFPDAHRVPSAVTRRWPLATADSLPAGRITLSLTYHGEPAANGVVELLAAQPDTGGTVRREALRRAEADTTGQVVLPWLPVPGGPWELNAFQDDNHDLRRADQEAGRMLPLTVTLTPERPRLSAGTFALYGPRDPGELRGVYPDSSDTLRALFGWIAKIAESDTGFVPSFKGAGAAKPQSIAVGDTTVWEKAGPGMVRAILFADLDGDSLLSALPDSAAVADTVIWRWEPFAVTDSLEIEPGLPLTAKLAAVPDTLSPCLIEPPQRAPRLPEAPADSTGTDAVPARADTLRTAPAGSTGVEAVPAWADTLRTALPDTATLDREKMP